jgi:hypothetical protein
LENTARKAREGGGVVVDYSIAAIPTEYRGRIYRSRLEARWAAFFDRLGLVHEYEPFDLGAWSPDFLLTDLQTLVEVKPLTEFDAETWAKMAVAYKERKPDGSLLLTRVAPQLLKHGEVEIGWLAIPWHDEGFIPHRAFLGWVPDGEQPFFWPEIIATVGRPVGWTTTTGYGFVFEGDYQPSKDELERLKWPETYGEHTMGLWAKATADVQWHHV